jgi:hypothetical protein
MVCSIKSNNLSGSYENFTYCSLQFICYNFSILTTRKFKRNQPAKHDVALLAYSDLGGE